MPASLYSTLKHFKQMYSPAPRVHATAKVAFYFAKPGKACFTNDRTQGWFGGGVALVV